MKRFFTAAMLALSAALILSCASTSASSIDTQQEVDDALKRVYNAYRSELILDGAGSYTVVSGDTLSKISRATYKDGFYFPLIMLASSDVVLDPDRIEPGMKLTIPDLQKNLNDARAKGKLKEFLNEIATVEDRRDRPADAEGLRKLSASL